MRHIKRTISIECVLSRLLTSIVTRNRSISTVANNRHAVRDLFNTDNANYSNKSRNSASRRDNANYYSTSQVLLGINIYGYYKEAYRQNRHSGTLRRNQRPRCHNSRRTRRRRYNANSNCRRGRHRLVTTHVLTTINNLRLPSKRCNRNSASRRRRGASCNSHGTKAVIINRFGQTRYLR